jgi:predicted transposase YbfD/YdcC
LPKKTLECAEKAGAVLITQVKNNQKMLLRQIAFCAQKQRIKDFFEDPPDKAHGRIEQRKYEIFEANPMLNKWKDDWPHIRSVIRVTRLRNDRVTISYYVSNGILSAQEFGRYIRKHWFIENKLHYVKDAIFGEDKSRKRVKPCIFSTFVDWSINLFKEKGVKNIRKELYMNAMDLKMTMKYVS